MSSSPSVPVGAAVDNPAFVASGHLELAELQAWARSLSDRASCWLLFERVPQEWMADPRRETGMVFRALGDLDSLPSPGRGRIYSEGFELLWEHRGDSVMARYLGGKEPGPPAVLSGVLQPLPFGCATSQTTFYLWGQRLVRADEAGVGTGTFAEARIPRLLEYPIRNHDTQHIGIQVCNYLDPATGSRLYWRCAGMEERR